MSGGNRPSVLATLRALVPDREIGFQHTLRVVERQADELLRQFGKHDGATPNTIVTKFPRVKVIYADDLSTPGASRWNGSNWVVFIRSQDAHTRQRFTLMHELAHIIHHGNDDRLFTGKHWTSEQPDETTQRSERQRQRERAADHFAGCLLMPRASMLRLWANGVRDAQDFAAHFDVSPAAATIRMEHLGLIRPRWMCTRGLVAPTGTAAPTTNAFSITTETAIASMRALGLQHPPAGKPSLRSRRRSRTLHHHTHGLRPVRRTL